MVPVLLLVSFPGRESEKRAGPWPSCAPVFCAEHRTAEAAGAQAYLLTGGRSLQRAAVKAFLSLPPRVFGRVK